MPCCFVITILPCLFFGKRKLESKLLVVDIDCRCQIQHYTYEFFVRTSFFQLRFGFVEKFVRKMRAYNDNEIDYRPRIVFLYLGQIIFHHMPEHTWPLYLHIIYCQWLESFIRSRLRRFFLMKKFLTNSNNNCLLR